MYGQILPSWRSLRCRFLFQHQGEAHLQVGGAPDELGRYRPQIDAVAVAKGVGTAGFLFQMMVTAQADGEAVMWFEAGAGALGDRAQMRDVDQEGGATRNAAAVRADEFAVPQPHPFRR